MSLAIPIDIILFGLHILSLIPASMDSRQHAAVHYSRCSQVRALVQDGTAKEIFLLHMYTALRSDNKHLADLSNISTRYGHVYVYALPETPNASLCHESGKGNDKIKKKRKSITKSHRWSRVSAL